MKKLLTRLLIISVVFLAGVGVGVVAEPTAQSILEPVINVAEVKPEPDVRIAELLKYTNLERTERGIGGLALSDTLSKSAKNKCLDHVKWDYWAHSRINKEWFEFINVPYVKVGENLAYGFWSSQDVVNGWMASPLHKDNILDPAFKEVGFGICQSDNFTGKGRVTIVVQHFLSPL